MQELDLSAAEKKDGGIDSDVNFVNLKVTWDVLLPACWHRMPVYRRRWRRIVTGQGGAMADRSIRPHMRSPNLLCWLLYTV